MTQEGIYYDASRTGPEHVCSCCDSPIDPIFKPTSKRGDWMYRSCDTCLEYCCEACSDEDAEGNVTCSDCLQTEAARKSI